MMEDDQGASPRQYNNPQDTDHESGTIDTRYIISKFGILKILEIVFLLIAFASLTGHTGHTADTQHKGRYDFFYFATITSWLIVIILFLVYSIRFNRRLNINWNLAMMVYSVVTAFMLLLSSALVLDAVIAYRGKEELDNKKQWTIYCKLEKCGNIEAAGAFGIFATAAFIIDAGFFFMENRRSSAPPPLGAEQF